MSATRCMAAAMDERSIRIMCLCPSIASTPILQTFSTDEIAEMKQNVGGFMTPEAVGDAFMQVLSDGSSGCVAAIWKDCPPYYIPDTGMGLFILYTACAMVCRFLPRRIRPYVIRPWPHMLFCLFLMLFSSILAFKGFRMIF